MVRKIIVEFVVPPEYEYDYSDVCAVLVIEDFIGLPLTVISDTVDVPVEEE